jgi:hypothetical protein
MSMKEPDLRPGALRPVETAGSSHPERLRRRSELPDPAAFAYRFNRDRNRLMNAQLNRANT